MVQEYILEFVEVGKMRRNRKRFRYSKCKAKNTWNSNDEVWPASLKFETGRDRLHEHRSNQITYFRELSPNQTPLFRRAPWNDTSWTNVQHSTHGATTTPDNTVIDATGALAPPALCCGRVPDAWEVAAVRIACQRPWSSPSWTFWGSNLRCAAVRWARQYIVIPGCTRAGCTSLDELKPDCHKEAYARRRWGM